LLFSILDDFLLFSNRKNAHSLLASITSEPVEQLDMSSPSPHASLPDPSAAFQRAFDTAFLLQEAWIWALFALHFALFALALFSSSRRLRALFGCAKRTEKRAPEPVSDDKKDDNKEWNELTELEPVDPLWENVSRGVFAVCMAGAALSSVANAQLREFHHPNRAVRGGKPSYWVFGPDGTDILVVWTMPMLVSAAVVVAAWVGNVLRLLGPVKRAQLAKAKQRRERQQKSAAASSNQDTKQQKKDQKKKKAN
jgi:hypothetical protein